MAQLISASKKLWYKIPIEEIKKELSVDIAKGLSKEEVTKRRSLYGPNILPRGKKLHAWQLFLRQFFNPLVIILLISAGLTFWLHEYIDFTVITLAVFVNVIIGFWQEYKSNQIFEKMNKLVEVTARVLRDGVMNEVHMEELVPGDIIILHMDMKVPASARLLSARDILINESILTGESSAVKKEVKDLKDEVSVGDQSNMVHMGTVIERGEGTALVVATGASTEIGGIASLTANVEDESTPLQKRLSLLGKQISFGVSIFVVIIFALGFWEGRNFNEMFTTSVAVAVAAIPEGLPAALSVVLAVSATRILRRRGLVKKLVGAETLGSTTVIVTDKTGTLTTGEMKVEHIISSDDLDRTALAMALASDVVETIENGKVHVQGEATDKAKVEYFKARGGNLKKEKESYKICSFIPFDQITKYIASFHTKPDGGGNLFISGAPERLLSLSTLSISKQKEILYQVEDYARKGYRMIGVAEKSFSSGELLCDNNESLRARIKDIVFLGVAAIRDPIRPDVKESLETTRRAGVRVIMATGDHMLTARSIGEDLGFDTNPNNIIDGDGIDTLSDEEIKKRLLTAEIFSRVSPAHKMRVTQALKEIGEVVAMTGDGVNDAPALKDSDIGISLGSGTDITKETADLILLDNSFSIITEAIKEGRIAFENIRKVTVFLLSNSFTEIIIIMAGLLMNTAFLPISAVQILWANLVEDTFPNFALAFEPGEEGIMERKPIQKNESILDKKGLSIIFIVGILADLLLVGVFWYLITFTSYTEAHVQTLIFALLATNSLFIVFSIKSYRASIFNTKLTNNKYLLLAVFMGLFLMGMAIYAPPLQKLLGTVPLTSKELLFVAGMILIQIILIEVVKWWFRIHEVSRLQGRASIDTIGLTLKN